MFDWIVWLILAVTLPLQAAGTTPYESLHQRAEASYAEKSFAAAHQLYEEAAKLKVSDAERRWIDFRLADTQWRSRDQYDSEAQSAVSKLTEIVQKSEHDRVWAEANESIGDSRLLTYGGRGNENYILAAEWWANSADIPLARERYLQLVLKLAAPNRWDSGREQFMQVPRTMLLDALRIAQSKETIAHLRYLLAMQLLAERRPESIERALELLDLVIREKRSTEWYDDALMAAADQLANNGDVVMVEGEPSTKPDYTKALELYRRITSEFKKGETRYYADAYAAIRRITEPSLGISTPANFLPDSEQQVLLSWRNVGAIELSIAKIDLPEDIAPAKDRNSGELASMLRDAPRTPFRRWTYQPAGNGPYAPGSDLLRISPRLDAGAYVVTATSGHETSRVVLLVTDIDIVTHAVGEKTVIYVNDVFRGAPVAGARVRAWQDGHSVDATTDANGLAQIAIRRDNTSERSLLVTASTGTKQAYVSTYSYWVAPDAREEWRIYAFTDRPAYRPGETVHWKIIARTRTGNEPWHTPARRTIEYEIVSPRNEKTSAGTANLNEFGSFWADLPLTSNMSLGLYNIRFNSTDSERRYAGVAQLFDLEEYKLPEYTVNVTAPKQYRLGDTVEAVVEARYYFGGPVSDATVEVTVDQSPYYAWNTWYDNDSYWWPRPQPPYYGGGQNILKQTLRTDANGRALVHFDTPREGNDMRYTISAKVTDASRREVAASTELVVMKQSYRVVARPQHAIGTPGEKISVDFKATDSREQPVKTTGKVHVVRKHWEPFKDRGGEYRDADVLTTTVTTNDDGEATFTFTPDRDGYYLVSWSSEDRRADQPLRARDIVKTETTLWVSRNTTTDLGYHAGGLELVLDRDVLHAGDRAPLIVMTENSGRWVLLTISAAEVISTQVLHLDGTAKLIELPIDQQHVPDFAITASSVFDRMLHTQSKTVKVPPVDRALTVEVKPDRDEYKPRQSGTLTVTTRDYMGRPVAAEVALSVADESVTAIAQDPAGDPRQLFYGESRVRPVSIAASMQMQRYARLIVGKDGQLIDDAQVAERDEEGRRRKDFAFDAMSETKVINGAPSYDNVYAVAAAPVAQAITVTAAAPMMKAAKADAKEPASIDVVVRSDFRSTAFWKPDVITDANGVATVKVDYPEALTEWRATARAATADSRFGMATSKSHTNQPLIVRLQAPRFFVVGDRSVVSAVINNNTDRAMHVTPSLDAAGVTITSEAAKSIDVPPRGEARADWTIAAEQQGTAKLRVRGTSDNEGDAMEKSFTVYEHGIDKLVAQSGKVRNGDALIKLELPHARRDTSLVVSVSPSLAAAMTDALPYLIDYPYGCTEQTMSRFLPASIVARTLTQQHLPRPAWMSKLGDVTKTSLARLYDFQHGDGGWGWWKDDDSQAFMTAYVLWGFAVAKEGGIDVRQDAAERGAEWLDNQLVQSEHDPNAQAWMLHALAAWRHQPNEPERRAFASAYAKREQLSAYSRALLALAAHDFGDAERAQVLVRNLENGAKIDRSPDRSALIGNQEQPSPSETMGTAHWGAERFWWHWYDGPVETTSFVLQALMDIDPQNKLVEPAMNWLVKNRRGSRWNNTRDTAIAILALDDYLHATGESSGDVAYEVSVNGKVIGTKSEASSFTIDAELVRDANQIAIRRTRGRGPLYFSVEGRFVSLEEPVTAAGHELFVRRDYLRLVPKPTLLRGVLYDEVPLRDGESLASGERVVVVVTIETKNDYEYLLFEDLKPAGLEAVSLNSGSMSAQSKEGGYAYVYQELRDRKVALFADRLAQGTWTIRYELRAETPGSFHALPVLGEAMYVPEIRANGEETHITVH
ncbi:MAG TPA: alpha-2-macroglobulin family protein [Thermoanaerobaculia bacterium]|nr:alpha-2-macroglobulin family protein [Thermoanaerobaculia bacterium]